MNKAKALVRALDEAEHLAELQRELMKSSAEYVSKGGTHNAAADR
jgi:hypothetical protein